jgi:signal peptidase I
MTMSHPSGWLGWRRIVGGLCTGVLLALIAAWAVTLRPISLGGSAEYVVIHGNSMFPLYHDGDLIISHTHSSYAVGDVVAYHVPQGQLGQGLTVIHRIIGGSDATGYVLKGDNNPVSDPWHPHASDVVGATWVHVPRLGKLFVAIHRPIVPGLFFGGLALILVLRWQTRGRDPDQGLPAVIADLERVTAALQTRYAGGAG